MRYLHVVLLVCCATLRAEQPAAIANDPKPESKPGTKNLQTIISSHGSRMMGILMLAAGTEPHGTVILLHGFPGYEQNMDLAQVLRRAGWNVLAMHYRGAWGSEGSFSFSHCIEDVGATLSYVTDPANAAKFHVNTGRLVVIGHSLGGFFAVAAMAEHPEFAAGVVITEGSPVNDDAGIFGPQADPEDYAPLSGTSPAALEQDEKANGAHWTFAALAPKIAPRPILVITANDALLKSNQALIAELKKAGCPETDIHMDTDHGFSDHRIALESAVLHWLDETVR